jgi:sugar phosphate permease
MSGIPSESRELRAFAPALVLLAICALINYVDRGSLSIAAPLLKDELRISASQLGILLSAFSWTYTAMQFVSGWVVDSFDASRVIGAGFLLWSLTTAATGFVRGFTMLLLMRLIVLRQNSAAAEFHTCYTAPLDVIKFKCAPNFGEAQGLGKP